MIGRDEDRPGDTALGGALMLTSVAVFATDYKSGAMFEHEPNSIDAVLIEKRE